MTLEDQFALLFGVWQEARPYLDRMVNSDEMRLVLALEDESLSPSQVAERLRLTADGATRLLEKAFARHIVNREGAGEGARYRAGSFPDRLDHFAKFEDWDDIPARDRKALDRRFLDDFLGRHRANVQRMMLGEEIPPEASPPNDSVLLLHEVEEMVEAAQHIVVQPCDCRRLGQNCSRPVETCIWLDDLALRSLERGWGRRLSREEARKLLRWADRKGLMHTADAEWRTRGLRAICNCCACDCYPFRAGIELASKGVWPRSRYVAAYDPGNCNLCAACVKRCHFGAFFQRDAEVEIDGTPKAAVGYDPALCWGCGLCANACPSAAITMVPLP